MESISDFLRFREFGNTLGGEYQASFNDIFSFVSWFALLIIAIWSLRWIPPFKNIIHSVRNDLYSEFSESQLVRQLIPNFQSRCNYYKILLWGMVIAMFTSYILSFCYGSYAIAALISDTVQINKFTAFFILVSLSIFMFFIAHYFMKEADKLATFLQRVIF